MWIKVIQQISTGKYISDIVIEYPPYTGWWYLTHDISKAMRIRSTSKGIWVINFLKNKPDYRTIYKEFSNL